MEWSNITAKTSEMSGSGSRFTVVPIWLRQEVFPIYDAILQKVGWILESFWSTSRFQTQEIGFTYWPGSAQCNSCSTQRSFLTLMKDLVTSTVYFRIFPGAAKA